ncbi:MAG: putative secreted protein [Glaciihabitans sp.]|nr:putative secreted protein [Glaciihabitans sp.]
MRRALAVVAVLLLALTGCASGGPHVDMAPNPRLAGEWWLVSGSDGSGKLDLGSTLITMTLGGRNAGRTPCNDYGINFSGTESLVFPHVAFTKARLCETTPLQDLEARYIAALEHVQYVRVTANNLTLTAPHIILDFSRAARVSLAHLLDRSWLLAAIYGRASHQFRTDESLKTSTLMLYSGGRLRAITPCRHFNALYETDAGEVIPTNSSRVLLDCDRDGGDQDADVLRVLSNPFTVTYDSGFLVVRNQRAGLTLAYRPNPHSENLNTLGSGADW